MNAVAAIVGAAGIPCLLMGHARRTRVAGLVAVLIAWVAFGVSLAPEPVWAVAAAVAVPLVAAALGRSMRRHVHLWLGLVGATLALRLPLSLGGEEARLLGPLYVVILGGVGAWWGIDRPRGRRGRRESQLVAALAAFAAMSTLATLWSTDPQAAAIKTAAFVLPFTLLFWLVVELWPDHGGVRALAAGGLGLAASAALVAVAQAVSGTTFGNEKLAELHAAGGVFRANAFLHDPNTLGRVMALGLVAGVGAGYLVARRGGRLAPLALVGALLAAGLVLSVSQSSGAALAAGLGVLLGRVYGWRRVTAVGALVAVLAGGWAILGTDAARDALASRERIARASDGRDHLVSASIELWRSSPVVGMGTGAFAGRYAETLTPDERRHTTVFESHTAPLTVLAELGGAGAALLVLLGLAALRLVADRRAPRAWTRAVIGAMLAAVFVQSLFTGALMEDPIVWALLALACAVGARRPAGAGDPSLADKERSLRPGVVGQHPGWVVGTRRSATIP